MIGKANVPKSVPTSVKTPYHLPEQAAVVGFVPVSAKCRGGGLT
jgi:hypothetical protein